MTCPINKKHKTKKVEMVTSSFIYCTDCKECIENLKEPDETNKTLNNKDLINSIAVSIGGQKKRLQLLSYIYYITQIQSAKLTSDIDTVMELKYEARELLASVIAKQPTLSDWRLFLLFKNKTNLIVKLGANK